MRLCQCLRSVTKHEALLKNKKGTFAKCHWQTCGNYLKNTRPLHILLAAAAIPVLPAARESLGHTANELRQAAILIPVLDLTVAVQDLGAALPKLGNCDEPLGDKVFLLPFR